uniref:Torsin-1A C-terminal domain-containing protein n=1 Tax=Timema douglasi TaxID=61478 RepID=A0A7R8VKW9_TIMDO|nr:unnamed protein product [Timema douglasi]
MLWRRCTLLGALLAVLPLVQAFLDPVSLSLTGIGIAAMSLYAGWNNLGCGMNLKECCNEKNIIANFTKLERSLMNQVFGQHLVIDIVVKALRGHFYRGHPSKALAMSFHGWPGGGKNYVSQFITNSLYAKGSRSQFVHFFAGKLHFPLQEKADIYRMHLQDWIRGNVSQCSRSTFIFDEVDKMPRGVLDAVKPFIDHHEHIDGVDYRHAIFIFLSNTGGSTITKRHLQLWQSGKSREDFELRDFEDLIRKGAFNEAGKVPSMRQVGEAQRRYYWTSILACVSIELRDFEDLIRKGSFNEAGEVPSMRQVGEAQRCYYWTSILACLSIELRDFEDLIRKGAFNEAGGFHKNEAIESNLIDHYVPFLPLEEKHVRLCVIEEFKKRGVKSPHEELVDEILKDVTFGPDEHQIFSNSGCKRLSHKVLTLIERLQYRDTMSQKHTTEDTHSYHSYTRH